MARSKSVILSASEKKAIVTDLRAKVKALTATIKANDRDHKAVSKAFDKQAAANAKELTGLQKQLDSLTVKAPAATPAATK